MTFDHNGEVTVMIRNALQNKGFEKVRRMRSKKSYAETFRMYSLFSRIAAWLFAGGVISIALDFYLRMVKRKCSMGI